MISHISKILENIDKNLTTMTKLKIFKHEDLIKKI